jgi:hypothetical protein
MAPIHKKAMGPHQSPMASHPHVGMALWVTLSKIKIKVIKIETLLHDLSFDHNIKHIGPGMSRKNFNPCAALEASFWKVMLYQGAIMAKT